MGQTTETIPGWLYVKIDENSSNQRSTHNLDLDNINYLKSYAPVKRYTPNARRKSSILDGLYKVQVSPTTDITQLCKELEAYGNVLYAEPIFKEKLLFTPNDPALSTSQSYLELIGAYEAWDITTGDSSMIIGISDTGVDYTHDDLNDHIYINNADPPNGIDDDNNGYIDDYRGYDFADRDTSALPGSNYHGTRVAGITGAETNNDFGMAGIAYNVKISPLKIFKSANDAGINTYESIVYAADNGYDVINLSWGSVASYTQAGQDIINYAVEEKNLIVIAAAGNTPEDLAFYPASYDNVLSVASTESDDSKASFSTYNYHVDISAPGRSIYSTYENNGFISSDGTSFSAPIVSGAAILVKSVFPELNARQIIERLRVTSDDLYEFGANSSFEEKIGYGRLNIERAVKADNDTLKSIRVDNYSVCSNTGSKLYYGDTITLQLTIKNYLATSSPTISISSPSEYLELSNQDVTINAMTSLSTSDLTFTGIKINDSTPSETIIPIRIGIKDGNYEDYQYVVIQTEPDRVDLDNGQITFTTSGNGNLAYVRDGFYDGLGLTFNGAVVLQRMNLFVAADSNQVSDNFYTQVIGYSRSKDFATMSPSRFSPHDGVDFYTSSTFSDDSANNPLGIVISQQTLLNESSNYLIQEYYIANTTSTNLSNIQIGMLTDWNLNTLSTNKSYYNDSLRAIISQDYDSSLFVAVYSYYDSLPIHQSIDLETFNADSADIKGSWTDSLIYELSRKSIFDSAGWYGGNDIAAMIADDSITIPAGNGTKAAYIFSFGNSLEEVSNTLKNAIDAYRSYLNYPVLKEKHISCEGASITIFPNEGENFRFYSDPFAQQLINEGDSLITGKIDRDTSFYYQILNESFISDIYRLDVDLVSQVANFQMSTDTLLLDDQTNSVSFTDHSFLPIDWLWNFGNNQQSTLQNPTMGYSTPGNYTISLTVNNQLGCNESTTKSLLVANRLPLPDIKDLSICIGEDALIHANNTDSLRIYVSSTSLTPVMEGTNILIKDLIADTIIYVSNSAGPFESYRIAVSIGIQEITPSLSITPDLTSTSSRALFINTTPEAIASSWIINENFIGTTDTISLEVIQGSYKISLTSTSTLGCDFTTVQTNELTKSEPPTLPSDIYCFGEKAFITPTGGTYFGFYSDGELTQLINKGKYLELDSVVVTDSIFITGLDNIIPSDAKLMTISPQQPKVNILASPDTLYLTDQNTVHFFITGDDVAQTNWYVNSMYFDNSFSPIMFFEESGNQLISVEVYDADGCYNTDSLDYPVYSERVPEIILNEEQSSFAIVPNPINSGSSFQLVNISEKSQVLIFNLAGQAVFEAVLEKDKTISNHHLAAGIYTIAITELNGNRKNSKLIVR